MAEGTIQLPPDSTGKLLRTFTRLIGASTVHQQIVSIGALETWFAFADAVAFAANKQHISLFNPGGSGVVIKIQKLFAIDLALAAVTGVAVRFDIKETTAQSAGTTITPLTADSNNAALPAGLLIATGATVTEGGILWPFVTTNDEAGATNAFPTTSIQQFGNLMIEGNEVQELTLRPGQGFTIKQITSSTIGSFGWILVFTVE